MSLLNKWRCGLGVLLLAVAGPSSQVFAAETNHFGFSGPEIFPIDNQIGQLHVADIDGDGLKDIIVANNARSKITILYNQTGKTNAISAVSAGRKPQINELPPDARFRMDAIASESRIVSMVVTDLNSDGRPDIAYYGEPKELVVLYNQGTNGWSAPKRWPIDDGQLTPNALSTGDLNGDGREDLVLLGENRLYYFQQKQGQPLGEPERIPFSGTIKSAQIVDVDGDSKADLLLVNWEERVPFRFRLQRAKGELGPEMYFTFPPIRSYCADALEPNKKTQVITIAQNSGRAAISEFVRKPAEALSGTFRQGQFQVWPLQRTEKAHRGLLWTDVNGDGLTDLLVAEPENGQLSVYLQEKDGALGPAKTFPTFSGVSDLAVADWNSDGKPEIFLLSEDEKQIGVTRLDESGRMAFPSTLPLEGRPLVMASGELVRGGKPVLACIVDRDGARFLVTRSASGETKSQKLSEEFKSNPSSIVFHDADQDGATDLIVLIPYEKVKILRQVPGKGAADKRPSLEALRPELADFEELDIAPPGGALEQPWLSTADVDGDGKAELLLTQKNFLRAVVLAKETEGTGAARAEKPGGWGFKVKEQINGASSNSRLTGAAAVPNGTNPVSSIFMLDAERKALTLCERDKAGVWQVVRNLPLPVTDFTGLKPLALGGKQANAVGFIGLNSVATLPLTGDVWELSELDGYESPIKDAHLHDVVSGDLDNDGRKDLVFLETSRNYLDLVSFDSQHKLVPANRWQVFEERSYRGRTSSMPEPREAVVADMTGNHKNDLVVLVHDRILLYPQE
jgi:hypothetical protein